MRARKTYLQIREEIRKKKLVGKNFVMEGEGDIVEPLNFYYGIGVKKDREKTKKMLSEAVEKGNKVAVAVHNLLFGRFALAEKRKKLAEMFEFLNESAEEYKSKEDELSNKDLVLLSWLEEVLGEMWHERKRVKNDEREAFRHFRSSGEKGNARALYCIAFYYEHGLGVEKDLEKAVDCLRKGGENGSCECLNDLAVMYEQGKGVKKDEHKALLLYQEAAQLGETSAKYNLGRMYCWNLKYRDYEKAGECFFQSIGNFYAEEDLWQLIYQQKIEWRPHYHKFWQFLPSSNLGSLENYKKTEKMKQDLRILTVLLVSKHRESSKKPFVSFFVRGIAFKVIKYICCFTQTTRKQDFENRDLMYG